MPPDFLLGGHYEEHRLAQLILHLCVAFYQISVGAGFDESGYLESSPQETIKVRRKCPVVIHDVFIQEPVTPPPS